MGEPATNAEADDRELFDEQGYLAVPDALSPSQVSSLIAAIDGLTGNGTGRLQNVADIIGRHDAFLPLVDLPGVLPRIRNLLGSNIWLNHSHFNVNPPTGPDAIEHHPNGYGWHRDGGAINKDVPWPAPLLSIKIGLYLTDLSEPRRGQTYFIRNSHKTGERKPGPFEIPETAFPLNVKPGTAVLFDRRMLHSIRSANVSDVTRYVIFIQYAFRWMAAVDAMTVGHLRKKCSSVRRQLLNLNTSYNNIDGAEGRSALYHPTPGDVPLGGDQPHWLKRGIRSLGRRVLGPRSG